MYDHSSYGIEADPPVDDDPVQPLCGDFIQCHTEPPTCRCPR